MVFWSVIENEVFLQKVMAILVDRPCRGHLARMLKTYISGAIAFDKQHWAPVVITDWWLEYLIGTAEHDRR